VFEAWLAELQVEEAAHGRARTAWLLRQAAEEGTFIGVLLDLAERGQSIALETASARHHAGSLVALGRDFFALRGRHDHLVLLRYTAVASVRAGPHAAPTIGDRRAAATATLLGALTALAGAGRRIIVPAGGGTAVQGELHAVGVDVMTVRLDDRSAVYVPLASVGELSVVDSG
jgi:hypothetical protein